MEARYKLLRPIIKKLLEAQEHELCVSFKFTAHIHHINWFMWRITDSKALHVTELSKDKLSIPCTSDEIKQSISLIEEVIRLRNKKE